MYPHTHSLPFILVRSETLFCRKQRKWTINTEIILREIKQMSNWRVAYHFQTSRSFSTLKLHISNCVNMEPMSCGHVSKYVLFFFHPLLFCVPLMFMKAVVIMQSVVYARYLLLELGQRPQDILYTRGISCMAKEFTNFLSDPSVLATVLDAS